MSDVIEAEAPEAADKPAAEGKEAQSESAEDKARRMGWRSADELAAAGKTPKKVKSAEEFLADGEEYAPFIKANNVALEKALEKVKGELAETKDALKQFGEFHTKAVANEYKRALAELEERQEAAAAAGDVAGVKKATQEIVALGKEASAAPAPDQAWKSAEDKWKADNPWFDGTETGNRAMTAFALSADTELARTQPGLTPAQRLAEVTKSVKAEFPEKFTNPNRERPGAVEGAGGARRSSGRDYSNLPAVAKAICDKWVAQKILTRDDYVKGYQWDEK